MKQFFPKNTRLVLIFFIAMGLIVTPHLGAEPSDARLVQAVMCESIENYQPLNPAVVFSISQGEVFCFSNFDPVIKQTHIFHKWYKKDNLIFTMRLTLSPPKWSSFSRVQLREADKGPWRVEIHAADESLLETLRFSMVD